MGLKEYLINAREKLIGKKVKTEEQTSEVKRINSSYTSSFDDENIEIEHVEDKTFISEKLDEILDRATDEFFPKDGTWYSNCFSRSNDLRMDNLPCHLRDNTWLSEMLKQNQKLGVISSKYILNYINNSKHFKEARHNYELEIVKWQINWMRHGGEGWIIDEDYGGDFINMSTVCDLGFRKGVVDTLTRIGMNQEVVEEGIEKNVDLWRDTWMRRAFSNEFDPIFLTINFSLFGEDEKQKDLNEPQLGPIDPKHEEAWLKMRRYEYYQRHKDIVDKYGVVLPEMVMNNEEVIALRTFLQEKSDARKQEISEYKEAKERVRTKRYSTKK